MTLYILDSDHLSLYQRGHPPLGQRLLTVSPNQLVITVISAEELIRGRLAQIRKASNPLARVSAYHWFAKTLDFLGDFGILDYNIQAEHQFQSLVNQKIRIGSQDLKIAAIVLSQSATLLTRNRRDFERIPGLTFEDWSVSEQG
ncbi:MAG: type II toxin-antitoxin system VapC family toxin [Spirulina sp. SIO3F2]|nr:type II toxin-antitoxin system VapC family toxin [Spirulina sp. SIO3F2]